MANTQQGWRAGTSSGGGGGSDEKVKISSADTTTDFLENKLVAGANITLTKQNVGGNEQIEVASTGGGGGLTSVIIQNTIYVAKNGDDGTGQRNDLSKPFLTIAGANGVAQSGDCIYVFAGSYAETGDTFSSNVFYHLEDGVTVTNSGSALVFDDGVTPKSINIYGNGRLACSGGTCIDLQVSSANIECYSVTGGIGMILGGNCNIRVRTTISSSVSAGIWLVNDARGYIEFDSLTAQNGGSGILATTTTNDELYIKGRFMSAEPSKGIGRGFSLANTGNQVITFEILQFKMSAGSELVALINSGNYYFYNCTFNQATGNAGFQIDGGGVDFQNCSIFQNSTNNFNLQINNDSVVNLINTNLNCNSSFNISLSDTAKLYIQDSVLRTDSPVVGGGYNIAINQTTVTLVIANSQLINTNPTGGGDYCILANTGDSNVDIRIQGNCVASLPASPNITNIIAGTNIIVDSEVIEIPRVINP